MQSMKFIQVITIMLFCISLSGCKKVESGEKKGIIGYKDEVYEVSIGDIFICDQGELVVELMGNMYRLLLGTQLKEPMVNIVMKVVVDGSILDYSSVVMMKELYAFSFKTKKFPEKIIVFSNDGSDATLTFDGKTKSIIK